MYRQVSDQNLLEKYIKIASESLGCEFHLESPTEVAAVELERGEFVSEGRVQAALVAKDSVSQIVIHIRIDGVVKTLRGELPATDSTWLLRLIRMTCKLLEKELEALQSTMVLNEYSAQISRDFEELVWTRDLTIQLQNSDIRLPLTFLVDQLFPKLLETVQASQLCIVQYKQPISRKNPIPPLTDATFQCVGNQLVNDEFTKQILRDFSDSARERIVVNNRFRSERNPDVSSFILLPIQNHENEFGWLLAVNRSWCLVEEDPLTRNRDDFHQEEFGTFEAGILQSTSLVLATHANNTHLHFEQQRLLIGIVRALISAVDAKDHATRGHSDRVGSISRRLAQELQFSERECEQVYLAGLLHDIGKIGVSDEVLLKRGSLTDEEYEQLKQHPVIGYQMLKHLTQVAYVLPGVLYHHESINGNGYPEGLVGEEIPLIARIIAVADAFDAMTSDRPYRKGMRVEVAEGKLRENIGPQWDEQVVNAFFAALEDIHNICFSETRSDLQNCSHAPLTASVDLISYAVGLTH